jgi:polycomb protein EED
MANTTDDLLRKIEHTNPDKILCSHNIALPGQNKDIIEFETVDDLPDEPSDDILLLRKQYMKKYIKIQDICSLSSCFVENYSFNRDLIAICGESKVMVMDYDFELSQLYTHKNLREENLCLTWGLIGGCPLLAVGGYLGFIYIFNIHNYNIHKTLEGHMKSVNSLQFMQKECTFLLSASEDLSVRMWNIVNGVVVVVLKNHTQGVLALDLHKDQYLCVSGGKDSTVKFWSLAGLKNLQDFSKQWVGGNFPTKEILKPVHSENRIHLGYVDCVKFYKNLIISKSQYGDLVIWKTNNLINVEVVIIQLISLPITPEINIKFVVHPQKGYLAVGGLSGECYLYSLSWERKTVLEVSSPKSEGIVRGLAFTGDYLVSTNHLGDLQIYLIK